MPQSLFWFRPRRQHRNPRFRQSSLPANLSPTDAHVALQVNLVWKLALILKGQGRSELLKSYHDERKASVQQVIDNDVIIASLISGNLPPKYEGRTESPK